MRVVGAFFAGGVVFLVSAFAALHLIEWKIGRR